MTHDDAVCELMQYTLLLNSEIAQLITQENRSIDYNLAVIDTEADRDEILHATLATLDKLQKCVYSVMERD